MWDSLRGGRMRASLVVVWGVAGVAGWLVGWLLGVHALWRWRVCGGVVMVPGRGWRGWLLGVQHYLTRRPRTASMPLAFLFALLRLEFWRLPEDGIRNSRNQFSGGGGPLLPALLLHVNCASASASAYR